MTSATRGLAAVLREIESCERELAELRALRPRKRGPREHDELGQEIGDLMVVTGRLRQRAAELERETR